MLLVYHAFPFLLQVTYALLGCTKIYTYVIQTNPLNKSLNFLAIDVLLKDLCFSFSGDYLAS